MNRATREAILRRVAASPSAAALVLRGGMRTRLLCPEVPRVVEDRAGHSKSYIRRWASDARKVPF